MSGTAMWSLSPTRRVCCPGGSVLLRTLPLPAVTRPSQILSVTVAGSLSATQTDARVGSTRRTTGPARARGRAERAPGRCGCGLDTPDDRSGEQQRQVELLRQCRSPLVLILRRQDATRG